jgi:hypothetical protein
MSLGACCTVVTNKPPVYPLIRGPVQNGKNYYVRFSIDRGCDSGLQTAWLDADVGGLGSAVTIRLQVSVQPPFCLQSPFQPAAVHSIFVKEGAPVQTNSPVTFSLLNVDANAYQAFGCSVDAVGNLLYSALSGCPASPTTPSPANFVFSGPCTTRSQPLETGTPVCVNSYDGRVLKAIPTASPDVFTLGWRSVGSPDGFTIAAVTFAQVDGCVDFCGPRSGRRCRGGRC